MPRNVMRAYGWASIAAGGGDAIAAGFRDDLTEAVSSGRLVLPLDKAREATNDLWRVLISAPGEGAPPGAPSSRPAAPAAVPTPTAVSPARAAKPLSTPAPASGSHSMPVPDAQEAPGMAVPAEKPAPLPPRPTAAR